MGKKKDKKKKNKKKDKKKKNKKKSIEVQVQETFILRAIWNKFINWLHT